MAFRLPSWLVKIAEIIFKGRQAGLWSEKDGIKHPDGPPARPENIKGVKH